MVDKKFDSLTIKQVYFGNWLRDYSQAIDVGSLSKNISPELIRIILWIMSFSEFGYGTMEFEVTREKLGVYRAEEHIDNPKGYAEGEDARIYDKRLRGPVQPEELEIDLVTGMKNYICNEMGGWPTSSEYVRKSLEKCIQLGRFARSDGGSEVDQYEAFRLLGQALHTLEDFSAHSNYCELVLISLGYTNVFPHVGSNCTIELNHSKVFPVVTGTFGGQDFLYSLLGGAQDSLSQVELSDVQRSLENSANNSDAEEALRNYFDMLPIDFSNEGEDKSYEKEKPNILEEMDKLHSSFNGSTTDPQEIILKIYPLMEFRDRIVKKIDKFFEKVPLITDARENIFSALTLFIMSAIQPILSPIINDIVNVLQSGTEMVVQGEEQFRVWNDPNYDNPTHSQLSKDHFTAYLNEPAGKIAKEVVAHVVPLVVQAWEDPKIEIREVVNDALEVFHHPAIASTTVQIKMRKTMVEWLNGLKNRDTVIKCLSAEGVRNGHHLKTGVLQEGTIEQSRANSCIHSFDFKIPRAHEESGNPISKVNKLRIRKNVEEGLKYLAQENRYVHQSEYTKNTRKRRKFGYEDTVNEVFPKAM